MAETAEPLEGGASRSSGPRIGTRNNEQGRFALSAPDGAVTLRFRRIGHRAQTCAIAAGENEVNVGLERDVLNSALH